MKDQYSINEILNAIDDLQNLKKERKIDTIVINKPTPKKKIRYTFKYSKINRRGRKNN